MTDPTPDQPDAARRQPAPPAELHPRLPEIIAALRQGRSVRDVAAAFDIGATTAHRLKVKLDRQLAEAEGRPPPERHTRPDPDAPLPVCEICALSPIPRSHIDRALFGTCMPDLNRIASAFKVDAGVLREHWTHTPRPAEFDPEPTPKPPAWRPKQPPHPLPADRTEADELVARYGIGICPPVTAWARTEFLAFCAKWNGPDRMKTDPWRNFEHETRQAAAPDILIAVTRLIHRLVELAQMDGSVLAFQAEQARVVSHAVPVQSFNAAGLIRVLAGRGITLSLDTECRIVASNAGALTELDRKLLATHRADLADVLSVTERF